MGSPEQVIDKILSYHALYGHDLQSISLPTTLPFGQQLDILERFALEVIPAVRAAAPTTLWADGDPYAGRASHTAQAQQPPPNPTPQPTSPPTTPTTGAPMSTPTDTDGRSLTPPPTARLPGECRGIRKPPGRTGMPPTNATAPTPTASSPSPTCTGSGPLPPAWTARRARGALRTTPSAWFWGQAKVFSATGRN